MGRIRRTYPEVADFSHWSPRVLEKLLRICHFGSLFLAGLSEKNQDVLWLTDQDDIAANVDRHKELVSVFGNISNHYLSHNLGHLRVATTASDTGKLDVEDFVSIADLAAGAVCDTVSTYNKHGVKMPSRVLVPVIPEINQKTRMVMNWFSDKTSSLKRIVISFELDPDNKTKLLVRHYNFHGLV